MNELTTYQPHGALSAPAPAFVPDYQSRAVQRLGEWVHSADAAYNVATRLVESSFVPQQFRGKPVEATAAILAGSEVGLSPMAALRSFDIIQGQAAARAITLRAIVQSFGHEIVLDESTATRCIMRGKRRGSTEWQRVTWTIDRAKDLGVTGKDNWKKQPAAMLVARATSEICRLVASDAILGIGYTTEEINDGATGEPSLEPEPETPAEPAAPATRRMSRARTPEPTPTGEADEEPDPGPLTDHTRKKMFALLGEVAPDSTPEQQRKDMGLVLGREIKSRSELTEDDAQAVIDALQAEKRRREIAAETGGSSE